MVRRLARLTVTRANCLVRLGWIADSRLLGGFGQGGPRVQPRVTMTTPRSASNKEVSAPMTATHALVFRNVLSVVLLVTIAGMVAAVVTFLKAVYEGRTLFPAGPPPAHVPWGWRSVLLV